MRNDDGATHSLPVDSGAVSPDLSRVCEEAIITYGDYIEFTPGLWPMSNDVKNSIEDLMEDQAFRVLEVVKRLPLIGGWRIYFTAPFIHYNEDGTSYLAGTAGWRLATIKG